MVEKVFSGYWVKAHQAHQATNLSIFITIIRVHNFLNVLHLILGFVFALFIFMIFIFFNT